MTPLEPGSIKVEARTVESAVHVGAREGGVLLVIGEPEAQGSRSTMMSPEQAEMVLHAIGLAVARIREEARLRAEERAGLAERLLDQEVRLEGLIMVQAVRDQWLIALGVVAVLVALVVIWWSRRR